MAPTRTRPSKMRSPVKITISTTQMDQTPVRKTKTTTKSTVRTSPAKRKTARRTPKRATAVPKSRRSGLFLVMTPSGKPGTHHVRDHAHHFHPTVVNRNIPMGNVSVAKIITKKPRASPRKGRKATSRKTKGVRKMTMAGITRKIKAGSINFVPRRLCH